MAKRMPVGTIRSWEAGEFIKAHDGNVFHNGWIPLSTSKMLEDIGKELDGIANSMRFYKLPINGEKFLDHEIGEFMKQPGEEFGKYSPDDFKKYEGFAGAGRYSFRNEFSRRFMKPKLDVAEAINQALIDANDAKGGSYNDDKLTQEEKIEIRAKTRADFKVNADSGHEHGGEGSQFRGFFTVEEANELGAIVKRTNRQLIQGLNFEGEQKSIYDGAVKIGESLPKDYARIGIKRKQRDEAIAAINEAFSDNWGVKESFKFWIEDKYSEYISKYKERIRQDEAEEQESAFGVALDEAPETFYSKVLAKLEKTKDIKDYPFQELISLRFEVKYNKQLSGEWEPKMLPAIQQIEFMMLNTPAGHFLSNNSLKQVTQENYNGGDHGGYAWYNPGSRQINLSKNLVEGSTSPWGRINRLNEFQSVLAHEVGHAVSYKFGREGNLKYKEFVVACGWSYEQEELRRGMTATGTEKSIRREGSNSQIPLLTEYAHKSPEEAFAEHYSIYHNNKSEIDHWLDTGDSSSLARANKTISDGRVSEKTVGESFSIEGKKSVEDTDRLLRNLHLDSDRHVKVELISPWETHISETARREYDPSKVRSDLSWKKHTEPVVAVNDHNRYEIMTGVNRHVHAKYLKKMIPSVSVSKEFHVALSQRGYSDYDIASYAIHLTRDQKVPQQSSAPRKLTGIEYSNNILPVDEIKKSENIFRKMRNVYNSEELKKALETWNF
jgi:hypothetical protein